MNIPELAEGVLDTPAFFLVTPEFLGNESLGRLRENTHRLLSLRIMRSAAAAAKKSGLIAPAVWVVISGAVAFG